LTYYISCMTRYRNLVLLLALLPFWLYAQPNPDSLEKVLPTLTDDTNKINVLATLAKVYADANPKKSIQYGTEAASLAERQEWKPGMAAAYNSIGAAYKAMADYPKALDYLFRSLKINEELKNDVNIGRNLSNIGNLYRMLRNYPKALEYFNKALAVNKKLDRKFGMTNNLSDMGIVYAELGDAKKAMDCFQQSLKISKEINDTEGVAIASGNIANIYREQKDEPNAIKYLQEALKINRALKRVIGIAVNLTNLGDLHYAVAMDTTGRNYTGTGILPGKPANLDKAVSYYDEAIGLYTSLSALNELSQTYKNLARAYLAMERYKPAIEAFQKHVTLKDSINSNDNKVKLANLATERVEYEKEQQVKLTAMAVKKRRNEGIAFTGGILLLAVFTGFVIKERRKSEKLLLNILPEEVAAELKPRGNTVAKHFDNVTVLFTDFVNFTTASERMTPQELVNELHTCFKAFDGIISKYQIEKIKTVGDAYLAVSGLPLANPNHARDIVSAALEIQEFVSQRNEKFGDNTFKIRIGVHSGNVVAGIVGVKKFAYDIWGDTVNTAARMEQNSEEGKINISQTTYDLVKDQFSCQYRGEIDAKHKGMLAMYFIDKTTVAG
jgi:adenylate cyclase